MRATRAMTLRSAIGAIALIGSFAASPATLTVGPGAPIRTIAQAARIAGDGDVVEIRGGSYDGDVAVWTQKRLTIRGVAGTPVLNASGRSAEGKAIWVIRDGDFVVENIAFEGARVDGGNGAGIRFERGRLTVRRCVFTDNENGLLTANFPDSELTIEDSRFSNAPRADGSLKHLLYVGRIARFTLVGSRFHRGFRGHLVKSRARQPRGVQPALRRPGRPSVVRARIPEWRHRACDRQRHRAERPNRESRRRLVRRRGPGVGAQ
jgi:hypothetical protein